MVNSTYNPTKRKDRKYPVKYNKNILSAQGQLSLVCLIQKQQIWNIQRRQAFSLDVQIFLILPFKGQLISKCTFSDIVLTFLRISALASKKRSNQKKFQIKFFLNNYKEIKTLYCFDSSSFQRQRQKSLVFWSKQWHQKDILKLTDL